MRIISGRCGGRTIVPPKNLRARPTTDFAKENLFNVLGNMIDFEDIEFASRGAAAVTSVEINAVHYNFIRTTAKTFGFDNLHAVKANVFLYLKSCAKKFDVIFSDAPYDLEGSEQVVDLVFEKGLLKEDGVFIFEHSKSMNFSDHPNFVQTRSYGSVQFSIFENKQ